MSRRTVVVASAWAAPAIVLAAATPAASASGQGLAIELFNDWGDGDVVNPWMDGDTYFVVRDAATEMYAVEGDVSLITANGVFEDEPVAGLIEDGFALLVLRPRHPAVGAVVTQVTATVGSLSVTKSITLQILADPIWNVTASGAGTSADPLVIAGGATSATYNETFNGDFTAGPNILLSPFVDLDTVITLTDVGGLLDPATIPGSGFDFRNSFHPLGAGLYGQGELRMDLARNGYVSTRSFVYEVVDFPFFVAAPTGRDHIEFFGTSPLQASVRIRIDNGLHGALGGVLGGAGVFIEDESGKFESNTGSLNTQLYADGQGVLATQWVPLPGASGTGTAKFTITSGGYTQIVEVQYTLPS